MLMATDVHMPQLIVQNLGIHPSIQVPPDGLYHNIRIMYPK